MTNPNSCRLIAMLLSLLFISSESQGFAEMVRHGYPNCITCHQSVTGGGLMTEYGRSISAELMSTWKYPGEEKIMYVATPSNVVNFGGDFRAAQFYQNRSSIKMSQVLLMQADLEGAVTLGRVTAVATAGVDNNSSPLSRRHYVSYRATEEIHVRAGRFLPAFGINIENHTIATRKGVGRNQDGETYNLEVAWTGENFDAFATAIFGRPDNKSLGAESGAALSSSILLGDNYKVGLGYFYGARDISKRHLFGPHAILGFTKRFYALVDVALQSLASQVGPSPGSQLLGVANYFRLSYELAPGFHAYLTQELAQLDFRKTTTASEAYGLGLQWFPRPHWELNLLWQKQRIGGAPARFADFAFLLAHFYL